MEKIQIASVKIYKQPNFELINDLDFLDLLNRKTNSFLKHIKQNTAVEDMVYKLTGYNFNKEKREIVGGTCNWTHKKITLSENGCLYWKETAILHEMCHAFQHEWGYFDRFEKWYKTPENRLHMEQFCETARVYFENKIRISKELVIPKKRNISYFSEHDLKFMYKHNGYKKGKKYKLLLNFFKEKK